MAHLRPPLDSKYYPHFADIGYVTMAWAQLEFNIDQAIWQLARVEQALGACITAQLIGVNGRLRALRSLITALGGSEDTIKAIGKYQGSLGKLQTNRNRTAHDPRMIDIRSGKIDRLQITAENRLEFGWKEETERQLIRQYGEIQKKCKEFDGLFTQIIDELNALPDTSRPPLPKIIQLSEAALVRTTDKEEPPPPPRSSRS